MKKILIVSLILVVSFVLVACGQAVEIDTSALIGELQSGDLFVSSPTAANDQTMTSIIKVDLSLVESYQYFVSAEYTGEEYGVFVCNSESDAKEIATQLETRKNELLTIYEDYATEALPRIEAARIYQNGVYAGLVIADNIEQASTIYSGYFA